MTSRNPGHSIPEVLVDDGGAVHVSGGPTKPTQREERATDDHDPSARVVVELVGDPRQERVDDPRS